MALYPGPNVYPSASLYPSSGLSGPSITRTNNAEGGSGGATPTTSDTRSGTAWDLISVPSGEALVYSTAQAYDGSLSYLFTNSAGTSGGALLRWGDSLGYTAAAVRFWVYLPATAPTANVGLARFYSNNAGSMSTAATLYLGTNGRLVLGDATSTTIWTSTSAVPTGTWVRLELYIQPGTTTSNGTLGAGYATGAGALTEQFTSSTANAGTVQNIGRAQFGKLSGTWAGQSFYLDGIALANTAAFIGASATIPAAAEELLIGGTWTAAQLELVSVPTPAPPDVVGGGPFAPAPIGPAPWSGPGLQVAVFDAKYTLQGYLNDYDSCSVTFQYLDKGVGVLVFPETHPLASLILQAGSAVVPVVVTPPSGRRWSGRVSQAVCDEGDGQTPALPGAGTVTATLVDEWGWLEGLLASPLGASTALTYPTGASEFDARTGPLETTVKGYVTDALRRVYGADGSGNLLGPVAVIPPPAVDTSPTVSLSAKWTTLAALVTQTLRDNNYGVRMGVWLPGDPQPAGLTLTAPTVLFDLRVGARNPQIVWRDETFVARKVSAVAPQARTAIVGLSGTGPDQTFASYTDATLAAGLGGYAIPELYSTATSSTSSTDGQNQAALALASTEGGLAVQATVQDGVPWSWGQDYDVGDLVTLQTLGLALLQPVTAVQLADDRQNGYRAVPTVGSDQAGWTPSQKLYHQLRSLHAQIAQLRTGT